jgi:hypothetical protein
MKLRYTSGPTRYARANENPVLVTVNRRAEASCLPVSAFHVPRQHRKRSYWRGGLFAVLLGLLSGSTARADEIFVTNINNNTIGAYTISGATLNAALISGLGDPNGIVVSGSDLFVTNFGGCFGGTCVGTVGEYSTSGATVNAALISGLGGPNGIVVSGSDLFVANFGSNTIGEYTTSGAYSKRRADLGADRSGWHCNSPHSRRSARAQQPHTPRTCSCGSRILRAAQTSQLATLWASKSGTGFRRSPPVGVDG